MIKSKIIALILVAVSTIGGVAAYMVVDVKVEPQAAIPSETTPAKVNPHTKRFADRPAMPFPGKNDN
ncbi:MAG: hypothetical protein FHP92_14940 [Denitromonas halophila]|nr:MAG: hypothetical protein FHP92_14940 [Denitromonas halophila]